MTETTTPTGDSDEISSGSSESLLETTEQSTAVEGNETEQESTDSGSDDNSSTTEESSSDNSEEQEDITAFAKSQGLDVDNLTDNELKLLTQLKKNSREKRQEAEAENSKKLDKTLKDIAPAADKDDRIAVLEQRQAISEAREMKQAFWEQNADDRKYESKMSELLLQEKETYGAEAAWQLAQNLPRLLREAKFAEGAFDSEAARESGRREEREELRRKQEAGADSAHASTGTATSNQKVDRNWIENEYDPQNPEHRKLLDKAIADGVLY